MEQRTRKRGEREGEERDGGTDMKNGETGRGKGVGKREEGRMGCKDFDGDKITRRKLEWEKRE